MKARRRPTSIHASAAVHPDARLGDRVVVGPYATVGPGVIVGQDSEIGPHAMIHGPALLGERNYLGTGSCVGSERSANLDFSGPPRIIIGNGNTIREFTRLAPGSAEIRPTQLGNDNFLMACCYVGSSSRIENSLVLANGSTIGEDVEIADDVTVSGLVRIDNSVHIGRVAMIGGVSHVDHDVPPFTVVAGNPARPCCINSIGMKRQGLTKSEGGKPFRQLQRVWRHAFWHGKSREGVRPRPMEVEDCTQFAAELLDFLRMSYARRPDGPRISDPATP